MNTGMLLESISDEAPCGVDLEYDNDFARLEFLFPGEQEVQMGDSVIEAQEPDWDEIIGLCESLLEKSKDLNLLIYLCVASLEAQGILGLSQSIQLLKDIVVRYWDDMYPQLDLDEPEDQRYIGRINILQNLSQPFKSYGDSFKMVERIRNLPISDSKEVGQFSLAHINAARENKPMSDGSAPPTLALVEASFQSSEPNLLQEKAKAMDAIAVAIDELETFLESKIGSQNSINFKNLKDEVGMFLRALNEFASGTYSIANTNASKPSSEKPSDVESAKTVQTEESMEVSSDEVKGSAIMSEEIKVPEVETGYGEIRTRDSVIYNIDRILAYYPKYEPGSPVPLLLRRARRLVNLEFMELMGDLAPSAKSELKVLIGNDFQDEENAEVESSGNEEVSGDNKESSW